MPATGNYEDNVSLLTVILHGASYYPTPISGPEGLRKYDTQITASSTVAVWLRIAQCEYGRDATNWLSQNSLWLLLFAFYERTKTISGNRSYKKT